MGKASKRRSSVFNGADTNNAGSEGMDMCRLCLETGKELLVPIFNQNGELLANQILECTSIDIKLDITDGKFPNKICEECRTNLERFHSFRKSCLKNNQTLINLAKILSPGKFGGMSASVPATLSVKEEYDSESQPKRPKLERKSSRKSGSMTNTDTSLTDSSLREVRVVIEKCDIPLYMDDEVSDDEIAEDYTVENIEKDRRLIVLLPKIDISDYLNNSRSEDNDSDLVPLKLNIKKKDINPGHSKSKSKAKKKRIGPNLDKLKKAVKQETKETDPDQSTKSVPKLKITFRRSSQHVVTEYRSTLDVSPAKNNNDETISLHDTDDEAPQVILEKDVSKPLKKRPINTFKMVPSYVTTSPTVSIPLANLEESQAQDELDQFQAQDELEQPLLIPMEPKNDEKPEIAVTKEEKPQSQCDVCQQMVPNVSYHKKKKHPKHIYVCEYCHRNLNSKSSLDRHVQSHLKRQESNESGKFNCNICSLEFLTHGHFYEHISSIEHQMNTDVAMQEPSPHLQNNESNNPLMNENTDPVMPRLSPSPASSRSDQHVPSVPPNFNNYGQPTDFMTEENEEFYNIIKNLSACK